MNDWFLDAIETLANSCILFVGRSVSRFPWSGCCRLKPRNRLKCLLFIENWTENSKAVLITTVHSFQVILWSFRDDCLIDWWNKEIESTIIMWMKDSAAILVIGEQFESCSFTPSDSLSNRLSVEVHEFESLSTNNESQTVHFDD
jgi:hypothetical protein